MNKKLSIALVVLSCFVMSSLQAVAAKKPWTVLVYIAADNTLSDFAPLDLTEMQKVGSNSNVNMLAYYSSKLPGKGKNSSKLFINKGSVTTLSVTPNLDSGLEKTFQDALSWACSDYPSDNLMVIMWDHGYGTLNPGRSPFGWKGICWDDTTGSFLTDRDCCDAFKYVCNTYRGGKKIDVVACDACLMASLEVAHTFRSYVNYFVASEETIPGNGYQYAYVLAPFQTGVPAPIDLAKSLVKSYNDCYKTSGEGYTLSALDLGQLDPLVANLNQISQFFIVQLKSANKKTVKTALAATITPKAAFHFGDLEYLDLYVWLQNALAAVPNMKLSTQDTKTIKDLINATLPLVTKPVLARCNSSDYSKSYGMTIYFPASSIDSSYPNLLWTGVSQWTNFLKAFIAV